MDLGDLVVAGYEHNLRGETFANSAVFGDGLRSVLDNCGFSIVNADTVLEETKGLDHPV